MPESDREPTVDAPEGRPPFGSWSVTYFLVLLSAVLVIAFLRWVTVRYHVPFGG